MLSSKGAEILEMIENSRTDEILDMDTFGFLESKHFIEFDGRRYIVISVDTITQMIYNITINKKEDKNDEQETDFQTCCFYCK